MILEDFLGYSRSGIVERCTNLCYPHGNLPTIYSRLIQSFKITHMYIHTYGFCKYVFSWYNICDTCIKLLKNYLQIDKCQYVLMRLKAYYENVSSRFSRQNAARQNIYFYVTFYNFSNIANFYYTIQYLQVCWWHTFSHRISHINFIFTFSAFYFVFALLGMLGFIAILCRFRYVGLAKESKKIYFIYLHSHVCIFVCTYIYIYIHLYTLIIKCLKCLLF